ncbi:MAG TPA: hypothetical protein VMV34_09835 [Terriglobia bacterium]|nr:hypothetical protein [Terriglobia bacterium]
MRKFLAVGSVLAVWLLMGVAGDAAAPAPSRPASHRHWEAQGRGHGNQGRGAENAEEHGNRGKGHYKGKEERSRARFSSHDRDIIHHYFLGNTSNLPPGLAKRGGNLPPGLERQLRENGTLPPGLQKRLQPFPYELARRLPPLPSGYSRFMLGDRALVLNRAHVIIDIMILAR